MELFNFLNKKRQFLTDLHPVILSKARIWFMTGLLCYFVGAFVFAYIIYRDDQSIRVQLIDQKLESGTVLADILVDKQKYAQIPFDELPAKQRQQIVELLNNTQKQSRISGIFSLTYNNGNLIWTGKSWPASSNINAIVTDSIFLANLPKFADAALNDKRPMFIDHQSTDGLYRVLLSPKMSTQKTSYLLGAFYNRSSQNISGFRPMIIAVFSFFYLILLSIPIILVIGSFSRLYLYTDVLTGLPNRLSFNKHLSFMHDLLLVVINIDRFKEINSYYGGKVGDFILIELSERLKQSIPKTSFLYRISGDEFAILGENTLSRQGYVSIGKFRLEEFLHMLTSKPFSYDDYHIPVDMTAGSAIGPEELIEKADLSLRAARKKGQVCIAYAESIKLVSESNDNIVWTRKLHTAISDDKIQPFFQPIIDNKTDTIVLYECLARLLEKNDVILPKEFLDVAKKARLYPSVSRAVVKKSFEAFRSSKSCFCINLCIRDFQDMDLNRYLFQAIKDFPDSRRVIIELVDFSDRQQMELIISDLTRIKRMGAKVAFDKFGSGYSNVDNVLKFVPDYVKIDQSLICEIHTNKNARVAVANIVQLAKQLNIQTIAVGVHCKEVLDVVKEVGVNFSQGWFVGKPQKKE